MDSRTHDEPREQDTTKGQEGTTFKREGPQPATNDTGGTVEEMNRAAEDAMLRNVRPDEAID